jgi:hypothetical protein
MSLVSLRVVQSTEERLPAAAAARIAHLSRDRSVLVVAVREPLPLLRQRLTDAGADLNRVFILDTVTDYLSGQVQDPEHEAYVYNPALLETIALRATRIIRAKADWPPTVVVDDVATLARFAGGRAVAQWLSSGSLQATPETQVEVLAPERFPNILGATQWATNAWTTGTDGSLQPVAPKTPKES